jgi:hypothetical protein
MRSGAGWPPSAISLSSDNADSTLWTVSTFKCRPSFASNKSLWMICCVLQDQGMQQWGFMTPVAEMQAIHVTSGQTSGERIATKRSAGHPDIKLLANCHNRSSGPAVWTANRHTQLCFPALDGAHSATEILRYLFPATQIFVDGR